jgi:formamidopyrimidine-DNA glycosylase
LPELPEVETIVRDLARLLPGRVLHDVEVMAADLVAGETASEFAAGLRGRRVRGVSRRAKNIVIGVAAELLVVNLGMTGRLLVADAGEPVPKHLGVRMRLDDGRELRYEDVRRFGRLQRFLPAAWHTRAGAMGLEPLGPAFTPETLHGLVAGSASPVKPWLMDQRRVVGIGNIYASEALFRASLDPRRPARSISADDARRLHDAVRAVLTEAIEFRGTTLLDYRDAVGERGGFAGHLRVYNRAGQPCRVCGLPIVRLVQAGRSTFFCAACQR